MKFRMFASLLTLFLVVALVIGGLTMAWFTSKDTPPSAAVFFTGSVEIEVRGEAAVPGVFRWEMEEDRQFERTILNTGSEPVFLRARLEETMLQEAAAGITRENGSETAIPLYRPGSGTEENPQRFPFLTAGGERAGILSVWEQGSTLLVEYETGLGWAMTGVQLAVADDQELIPAGSGGILVTERFPFIQEFPELTNLHTFEIHQGGTYRDGALKDRPYDWAEAEGLSIAATADLIGDEIRTGEKFIHWSRGSDGSTAWEYNGEDGYWYYCREPLLPGAGVSLSLTGRPLETGLYHVKLRAEAVQALPGAAQELWGY